jgi:hypothetical protein
MFHTGRAAARRLAGPAEREPAGFRHLRLAAFPVRLLQRIALFYARVPCVATGLPFAALAG